ncbi:MAG: ABC transporter ATP-binding protein [Phycisphaerae bacterium]
MSAIVAVENVHKHYRLGREDVHALRGVSLSVARAEFVAVMGASGSGKSTLMHLLGGLDLPDAGRIVIAGAPLNAMSDRQRTLFRRRRMGIVFQSYNLLPTLTALENVMLPLMVDGEPAQAVRERARALLARVHLDHRLEHQPAALSGGEQQRVAIARALLNEPDVLLADEPTGNLDPTASADIWRLLRGLVDETGTTVVMVTHEPAAAATADRVFVLRAGELVGEIATAGEADASLVAGRYAELAR